MRIRAAMAACLVEASFPGCLTVFAIKSHRINKTIHIKSLELSLPLPNIAWFSANREKNTKQRNSLMKPPSHRHFTRYLVQRDFHVHTAHCTLCVICLVTKIEMNTLRAYTSWCLCLCSAHCACVQVYRMQTIICKCVRKF